MRRRLSRLVAHSMYVRLDVRHPRRDPGQTNSAVVSGSSAARKRAQWLGERIHRTDSWTTLPERIHRTKRIVFWTTESQTPNRVYSTNSPLALASYIAACARYRSPRPDTNPLTARLHARPPPIHTSPSADTLTSAAPCVIPACCVALTCLRQASASWRAVRPSLPRLPAAPRRRWPPIPPQSRPPLHEVRTHEPRPGQQ